MVCKCITLCLHHRRVCICRIMSKPLSKRKEKAVPSSIGSNVDKQPSKQTSSLQLVFPPSSSKTSQSINEHLLGSPEKPIIVYVHNRSPIKRNKKNTIDYKTLTLQISDNPKQPALCYSKNKRKILEEKETTQSLVKIITRYTTSTDKTKIIINHKRSYLPHRILTTTSNLQVSIIHRSRQSQTYQLMMNLLKTTLLSVPKS